MAYTFDQQIVADAATFQRAANAQVTVYDINDTGNTAPLVLTDLNGLPLTNPLTSSADAAIPAFKADVPQVKLVGGGLSVPAGSFNGVLEQVQAAAADANAAKSYVQGIDVAATTTTEPGSSAAVTFDPTVGKFSFSVPTGPQGPKGADGVNGADGRDGKDGANVLPTDTAVAQAVNDPASSTRAAMKATIDSDVTAKINDTSSSTRAALNSTFARKGPLDARDYGVVADGTTDDRAALVSALTAASGSGNTVLLPPGTIKNAGGQVDIPNGVALVGRGRKATAWTGNGVTLGTDSTIEGVALNGSGASSGIGIDVRNSSQSERPAVLACELRNWSTAGVRSRIVGAGTTAATGLQVVGNYFFDNAYAIFAEGLLNSRIEGNYSKNAAATGRHIMAYSGTDNLIRGNQTFGGIVGIGFLLDRNVVSTRLSQGNVISGNSINAPSEEGISFDLYGNSGASVSVLDWGTIASVSHNVLSGVNQLTITMDSAFTGAPSNKFYSYTAFVTTGTGQGFTGRIAASNGLTITINNVRPVVATQLKAGDELVIGITAIGNTIQGNSVTDAGTYGIGLWGMGVGNQIIGNDLNWTGTLPASGTYMHHGLEVWGLDGMVVSTGNYTGRAGRAPSVKNVIRGNTLRNANSRDAVKTFSGAAGYTQSGNVWGDNIYMNAEHLTAQV